MTTLATLLQGRLLADRYRIGEALGFGGMGAVFRAHDERLGRDVAVKVLTAASADPAEQEVLRARFRREARAAAALRHPNVVTVHDFGTDAGGGFDFLVMELLPGVDVAERMAQARGPLSVGEALEIVRESAMGLAAGHRAGLVHRDVKPRNLFLVPDPVGGWEVKVLDFGIAQVATGDETEGRLTQHGPSPHTPRYAAPEQLAAAPSLTPACDVYALGLVALEMLSGRYPEGLNTATDDAVAAREGNALRGRVPASVCDLVLRMLSRDPAARPANADAVLRLLGPGTSASEPDASPTLPFASPAAPPPIRAAAYVPPAPPAYAPPIPPASYAPQPAYTPPPGAYAPSATHAPQPAPYVPPPAAPPAHAPAAPPAHAPAAPPAHAPPAPASGEDSADEPRRRNPLKKWGAILLGAGLIAALYLRGDDPPAPAPEPAPTRIAQPVLPDPPAIPPEEAAAREIANQEALRAVRLRNGIGFGEKLWIVVAATRAPSDVDRAVALRDRLIAAGHPAGLANARVYPELPADSVVVLAGPYDRERARAALPPLRRLARGAALREVTFQLPR